MKREYWLYLGCFLAFVWVTNAETAKPVKPEKPTAEPNIYADPKSNWFYTGKQQTGYM
jgi:hypothetical protein